MNSIDDSNCKEIYDQLDIGWREDFWKLFAEFKVYSHVWVERAFVRYSKQPHFPANQGHIKRPVLEIGRAERGRRPANQ